MRPLILALAVAVLCSGLLGWLASDVAHRDTMQFDLAVRNAVHANSSGPLTWAMRAATLIGEPYVVFPAAALAFALFWRARLRHRALLLAIVTGGAAVLNEIVKRGFHRARPEPFFGYPEPSSYSFPSGHALFSICFFGALAALVSPSLKGAAPRAFLWLATVVLVAAIGFSRIYLGVHYPTDVVGGYLTGLVWTTAVAVGNGLWHDRRGGHRQS